MNWDSQLNVTQEEIQARVPITVFHVQGRINMSNYHLLEQAAQVQADEGTTYFLFDLNGVPSLTSAGLRAIQSVYKMTLPGTAGSITGSEPAYQPGRKSPTFKLVITSPDIQRVFQLAGFDTFIDIFESVETAIASF